MLNLSRWNPFTLLQIVRAGNVEALQEYVEHFRAASQHALNDPEFARRLMMQAAQHNQPGLFKVLLDFGAELDATEGEGDTPLGMCFWHGNPDSARFLLGRGADPHHTTAHGTRVFDRVIAHGDPAWIQHFLHLGCTFDHQNVQGVTALHWAAHSGNLDLFQWVKRETHFTLQSTDQWNRRVLDFAGNLPMLGHIQQHTAEEPFGTFTDGDTSLHRHLRLGHLEVVQHLFSLGADVNLAGKNKETPLHAAVTSGDPDLVQCLLSQGAKVGAKTSGGYTPLHRAARMGHTGMCEVLLQNRAKLEAKTHRSHDGVTPLLLAIQHHHTETALLLLEWGADANALSGGYNHTPLCEALNHDHLDVAVTLLQKGATPGATLPAGGSGNALFSPLGFARSGDAVDLLLAAGADLHETVHNGNTPLHDLVRWLDTGLLSTCDGPGRLEAIERLVHHGADVQRKNQRGETPLSLARLPRIVERLTRGSSVFLQRGCGEELHQLADDCYTPERLAALEALLDRATPEDLQYTDPGLYLSKETALHRVLEAMVWDRKDRERAPLADFMRVVHKMLKKRAPLHGTDERHRDTLLHKAAKAAGCLYHTETDLLLLGQLLETLLDQGAKVNRANRDGLRPLDFLHHIPHRHLLIARGAQGGHLNFALFEAIDRCDLTTISALLEDGVELEQVSPDGDTPLMHAARADHPEAMDLLIRKGAFPQATDPQGFNLLHTACAWGSFRAAQHAMAHLPIDLNQQAHDGSTALHVLMRYRPHHPNSNVQQQALKDAQNVALKMVSLGARLDLRDEEGETPLDLSPTQKFAAQLQKAAKTARQA